VPVRHAQGRGQRARRLQVEFGGEQDWKSQKWTPGTSTLD
jgi:hypothetical protein